MGSNSQKKKKLSVEDGSLKDFIERAIEVGVDDVDSLAELIPDEQLRSRIRKAAEINPALGRKPSVDDLVQEIQMLEKMEGVNEEGRNQ